MNKNEFVGIIAEKSGYTKKASEQMLDIILESVINAVADDGKLKLVDFGTFEAKQRKPRTGRNPKNQEEFHIPSKRVVRFKTGKKFGSVVAVES